jgi:putative phosphoribosyl transferase
MPQALLRITSHHPVTTTPYQCKDGPLENIVAERGGTVADASGGQSDSVPAAVPVAVEVGSLRLAGDLSMPADARGVVVFAHGSGSSRHSPRNRVVASALAADGWATLLFDLLTPDEELRRDNVFDIELLAKRLVDATEWLWSRSEVAGMPVGYFGASTGAAAALWAAADLGDRIGAVVSRGGRPDLAMPRLRQVTAPTLLIVGGRDEMVLEWNEQAQRHLECVNELVVVPGATHLFEEPGALEQVIELARRWFRRHLTGSTRSS